MVSRYCTRAGVVLIYAALDRAAGSSMLDVSPAWGQAGVNGTC